MIKLLIIEDDETLAELYKVVFKQQGFEVESAIEGEIGLQKAQMIKPDLILLDLMMPRMNGLEVLERLKQNEETKNILVIIITNLTDSIVEAKARKAGVCQYLLKSQYLPQQLVDVVNNTLKANTST
jgi:two-component system alkaline phosphatase synthesis response regulator PhoP